MAVSKKVWDAMKPPQQAAFQTPKRKRRSTTTSPKFDAQEEEAIGSSSRPSGKKVYAPDINAFRSFAQKKYLDKYGADWPKGALERINAL